MKYFILVFFVFCLKVSTTFGGGGEIGAGGGGPAIILRTMNDVDLRIITGGHWDINDFDEDVIVIENKGMQSILDYKFELDKLGEDTIEWKLIELIHRKEVEVLEADNIKPLKW